MNSNTLSIINTIIATAVSSGNLKMLIAETNCNDNWGLYGLRHTFFEECTIEGECIVEIDITPEEECWMYTTDIYATVISRGEIKTISRGEIKTVKQLKSLLYPNIPCSSSKEEVVKYFKSI